MKFQLNFKKYVFTMLFVTLAVMLLLFVSINVFNQVLNGFSALFQLNFLISLFSILICISYWILFRKVNYLHEMQRNENIKIADKEAEKMLVEIKKLDDEIIEFSSIKNTVALIENLQQLEKEIQKFSEYLTNKEFKQTQYISTQLSSLFDKLKTLTSTYSTINKTLENQLQNCLETSNQTIDELKNQFLNQKEIQNTQTQLTDKLNQLASSNIELDDFVNEQLNKIIIDTENSAISLMESMNSIHSQAQYLLNYIADSNVEIYQIENDADDIVKNMSAFSEFITRVPERIRHDIESVREANKEIESLANLVDVIKEISFQTDILAVNAAIQAAHAGESGVGFKIVADEVRKLAINSNNAAQLIETGLTKTKKTIEEGLKFQFLEELILQLEKATLVLNSLEELRNDHQDTRKYYSIVFSVIKQHNVKLAKDIAEVLGEMQTQDVVKQRIERTLQTTSRYNEVLQKIANQLDDENVEELKFVLEDCLQNEARHKVAKMSNSEELPQFELF